MSTQTLTKAIRIHNSGGVHHHAGDTYRVKGDHASYDVNLEAESCSCPARVPCSHLGAATIAASKTHAAAARKLEARKASRRQHQTAADHRIAAGLARMAG